MPPEPDTLFHPDLVQPINVRDQVLRLPGVDAPCLCQEPECAWPFCCPDDEEDEADP